MAFRNSCRYRNLLALNASLRPLCAVVISALLCLFLAACSANKNVKQDRFGFYEVAAGDTLYSISWRNGIDFKQLARWNGIRAPYTIYPGQKIRLTPPPGGQAKVAKQTTKTKPKPAKPKVIAKAPGDWRWPVKGKLLQKFSSNNQGIDIAAASGMPVVAASAGKVVYAGSGLRGYGNLLIIKHNATYFSAYAHNKRIVVREGVNVKAGEKIAEVGSTGTDRNKLHFEIRKNGDPQDPLKFLPR